MSKTLLIAHRLTCTEAEGPGRRYALWLQGCPLRCPGCCNPEFLPFRGGETITIDSILEEIDSAYVEGISLLGGEPTAQAESVSELASQAQSRGLSVMLYSGYTLKELQEQNSVFIDKLLQHTDILVDGRYDRDWPDTNRRWVGSVNQVVHFLSGRYRADDACWRKPNTLELRMDGLTVSVNGFPATEAKPLWHGWSRT